MAKLNDIRMLVEFEAKEVAGSPQDWMRYLDTASRLYRYPFSDTLLIHNWSMDVQRCNTGRMEAISLDNSNAIFKP